VSVESKTVEGAGPKGLPLPRRVLYAAAALVAIVAVAALLLGGRGAGHSSSATTGNASVVAVKSAAIVPAIHPHGAARRSGAGAATATAAKGTATGSRSAGAHAVAGGKTVAVAEIRDPEEAKSFPLPASTHHQNASTPEVAGEIVPAAGAASDSQIRKELGEEQRAKAQESAGRAGPNSDLTPVAGGFSVGGNGSIPIPRGVPEAVQRVVAGGNAIADFPYIWGGGHASFVANGYDCSGSVSYALAAGGLLNAPLVSGELASWGAPGPGRWITIYADNGHTFMDVDGMWFDTAGRSGPYASRWLVSTPSLAGYAVRHPPGY
jgi:cell wall-associated NlpC family hydrolase